jgi:hypothetical protein
MYRIIGTDQKVYGPASPEDVRAWIAEGRVHRNSLAQMENASDWRPLSSFSEFAEALNLQPAPTAPVTPMSPLPIQQSNSMAVAGLILSSVALVCCGCAPIAILGLVFSCIGLVQANRDPAQSGRGLAIAGIIIGIIALLGTVVSFAFGLFGTMVEELKRF